MTGKEELIALRKELHEHNYKYYVLDAPTVSDFDYDQKMRRLQQLEAVYTELADPNSPTSRVGSSITNAFDAVKHKYKMLSLDNAFTGDEVISFFNDVPKDAEVVIEPKIDGLSLSLLYKDGKLEAAVTRGDGEFGEVVTENARTVESIPTVLRSDFTGEVRGEVYMKHSDFLGLNDRLGTAYKNPRNTASGSLKLKSSMECAERPLSFFAYDIMTKGSQENKLALLEELGFVTAISDTQLCNLTIKAITDVISEWEFTRSGYDYPIDGLVIKLNEEKWRNELGAGTKYPKWAVAYKFPPERKKTILNDIVLSVGRLGTVTPVAQLEPVQLSGTTVSKASLCNQDEIERLGINVGDEVLVEKSGEIIPKVMGLSKKRTESGHWTVPSDIDGVPIVRRKTSKGDDAVAYELADKTHPLVVVQRIEHAVGKHALDIDGIGPKQVDGLVKAGMRSVAELFTWDEERLSKVLTAASLKKFLSERDKAKEKPLWRKIHAFGVESVGVSTSKDLEQAFGSVAAIDEAGAEKVAELIGDVKAKHLVEFFDKFSDDVIAMHEAGVVFESTAQEGALTGMTFCITGELEMGSRPDVAAMIEAQGGVVKSSMSKKVNYLVVGEGAGNTKAQKAAKLGIRTIDEAELENMLGN